MLCDINMSDQNLRWHSTIKERNINMFLIIVFMFSFFFHIFDITYFVFAFGFTSFCTVFRVSEVLGCDYYGYQIQEAKLFHKVPIVKVLLSKTEDVVKILKDNDIQIGYSMTKVEPFDKGKSRQKSHFKKCKKCYRLKNIARECPKKRKILNTNVCYAESREKLGIKLTRKEDALMKEKAYQAISIKSNVHQQAKNYFYIAAKGQRLNGNENNNGYRKPKKRQIERTKGSVMSKRFVFVGGDRNTNHNARLDHNIDDVDEMDYMSN
ncbi:hypothetical protein RFI_04122 [Reticulomyxa filosa]|uniref:Uncharacterized protein n=1 Tax=Reticulomyxa filosa TaxID=46433 RepID=X6P373_RETFI|nr:hypothetical protein RFI_04122 [Reticulomyxa filosa]|eukprot:ETO32985.1 hypothetical protein RFI_04122 [Reticulomyxa filosa]